MPISDPSALRALVASGAHADAYARVLQRARSTRAYGELRELVRLRGKLAAAGFVPPPGLTATRVAIGGHATTTYIAPMLTLLLETHGIAAELHELPFGSMEAEVLRDRSALAAFAPQVLVFVQSPLAISDWPPDTATEGDSAAFADARAAQVLGVCGQAHARLGCDVVLDNWHALPARPHGSYGRRMPGDRNALLRRMNAALDRDTTPSVHVHDVDGVAALHGLERWIDWRFWFSAKQPMSFDAIGQYAASLAARTAATRRAPVKCVVLDLDHTLWGGVIGDDGLAGIKIRQGDPEGEAFLAFQRHMLRLKQRGIVLAVCSKNEEENARAPFRELPDMVLRLDDFVAFKANWDPKPTNIAAIASELNLGLDALAFVDDNPMERDHVRQALPAVRVIDLPEDPAAYPAALDASGWFETTGLSAEDLARTEQYRSNAVRDALASTIGDFDAYLASLAQHAIVQPFVPADLDRIAQLINKTNQFNLTTVRVNRADVDGLVARPDVRTATVRLTDRFGDNGLIAVWYGTVADGALRIDQWLMSCRVFNRGVEQMLMNHIVALARDAGVAHVIGEYRPTAKNGVVRDLYARLGFRASDGSRNGTSGETVGGDASAHDDGATGANGAEYWQLSVADYQPLTHAITVTTDGVM